MPTTDVELYLNTGRGGARWHTGALREEGLESELELFGPFYDASLHESEFTPENDSNETLTQLMNV